ncbi:MAG: hybrid sensor histidine kinase/response regulator [Bacteroidetes bacterium]|nr:hybrid sensor histidine kinase/response regulator [Bacteroidota bacterium]
MLHCIIIDDDAMTQANLRFLCTKHPSLKLVQSFSSPVEALQFLENNPISVDLIFLDIEMPEMSGLDLLDLLSKPPMVIIVTTNPIHAFAAFEYKAVDFLKKPISKVRFEQAVQKAIVQDPNNREFDQRVEVIRNTIQKLAEEKRNMISLLAHDLRNPLFSLQIKVASLKAHRVQNKLAEDIEQAIYRIRHLTSLILRLQEDEALEISKISAPFALKPLLESVVGHLKTIADSRKVRISIQNNIPDAVVLAEPTLLEHIIENILSNAVKFSPEFGRVDISVSELNPQQLKIRISDHGPGISSQKLVNVFNASKPDMRQMEKGLGIGLSLSKRFAELMQIALEVEDTSIKGTTIALTLKQRPACN